MNILVSANDRYMFPLKVMLTSLLETNSYEHHNIYFLYNSVQEGNIKDLCQYVEKNYNASIIPYCVNSADFQEFPVCHHFSIETYYRFLAQNIIPKTEDRVLWLDVDMIVKKSIKTFYNQDFQGKYLVVCQSINKNPQILLEKLKCPSGTVYFNAGTILFNLNLVRKITLNDYHKYYVENKDQITWLDQDILNGMYALKTKIADYKIYNMQMFSNDIFTTAEKHEIRKSTAIVHYIGPVKPWHIEYKNPCVKYWIQYAKKVWMFREYIVFFLRKTLYPLRCLHGQLYEWWMERKRRFAFWKYITFPLGSRVYILGTPTHSNIGDSAIVLAERFFLERAGFPKNRIKEVTIQEFNRYKKILLFGVRANKKSIFCWHGGGNFGDQWLSEELFRRQAIGALPRKTMIIFPQTIYYTDTELGHDEEQKSVPYYNGREGLTLVAREKRSYGIMQNLYPDTPVLLTPDIVLSATMDTFGAEKQDRKGILLCMREDSERSVTQEDRCKIISNLQKYGYSYRMTDMYSDCSVTKDNRAECVRRKMNEFSGAELVITDRLHGMVFSAITGTPCIVFSNNNHKVRGTYEWIDYLPYIKYAESVEDAEGFIPELLAMKNCYYDNTPLLPYFDKIAEVISR